MSVRIPEDVIGIGAEAAAARSARKLKGIAAPAAPKRTRRPAVPVGRASVAVLLVGLAVAATLSWVSYAVNDRNETRLLQLQTKQTGTVLQVVLPTIQTPLASAAEIAATSGGDVPGFRSYIASYVGPSAAFVSASLWQLSGGTPRLVSVVGAAPELDTSPGQLDRFLSTAARTRALSVTGPIGTSQPRLGYAYSSAGGSPSYVLYAEAALPADRRATVAKGSPFSSLRFAIYLGRDQRPDMLLESNTGRLPISGRTATVVVPFGANALTLVASPAEQLGGALSGSLWWIVAIFGVVLAVAAALIAERLVRRRAAAERLTGEVQHLLGEQRSIAESLQQALLPRSMPAIAGVEIGVRYLPGVNGVEIGGDWYDVIALDGRRFFFAIGDVSGRGVSAGSVMASLHFAIRALVSEGYPPANVLGALRGLLSVGTDGHFATVLCGIADNDRHEVTIANAGHLPPLLLTAHGAEFLSTAVGPPIGIAGRPTYAPVTVPVPRGATLLLFTDGLVERRGESLDDGFARLLGSAVGPHDSLEGLLTRTIADLVPNGCDDDTAILGVRWVE